MSGVMCHVPGVTFHVTGCHKSCVPCHFFVIQKNKKSIYQYKFNNKKCNKTIIIRKEKIKLDQVVELVNGRFVINGATPSSLCCDREQTRNLNSQ